MVRKKRERREKTSARVVSIRLGWCGSFTARISFNLSTEENVNNEIWYVVTVDLTLFNSCLIERDDILRFHKIHGVPLEGSEPVTNAAVIVIKEFG